MLNCNFHLQLKMHFRKKGDTVGNCVAGKVDDRTVGRAMVDAERFESDALLCEEGAGTKQAIILNPRLPLRQQPLVSTRG
jgi:hypothetical protein